MLVRAVREDEECVAASHHCKKFPQVLFHAETRTLCELTRTQRVCLSLSHMCVLGKGNTRGKLFVRANIKRQIFRRTKGAVRSIPTIKITRRRAGACMQTKKLVASDRDVAWIVGVVHVLARRGGAWQRLTTLSARRSRA